MTFSVPEPLAAQFLRRVSSRDRWRFVSEALAARLQERDAALIRACEIANQDLDVAEIEREFDGIGDEIAQRKAKDRDRCPAVEFAKGQPADPDHGLL